MYRYTLQNAKGEDSHRRRLLNRVKNILILIMTIVLIGGAVFCIPSVKFRAEISNTYIQRIVNECGTAVNLSNSLSRTAGATTTDTLGRIRSHIYAMEVINSLHAGAGDGWVIQTAWFTTLYSILDDYNAKMTRGTNTSEEASNLQNNLQTLYAQLSSL